jgi:hypothetical protein
MGIASREVEIKAHLKTAINGIKDDQPNKARIEVSIPKKTLHITSVGGRQPIVAQFYTDSFRLVRRYLKEHIDFSRFLVDGEPYKPGALLIKLKVSYSHREAVAQGEYIENIGIAYYSRKDEWYCYRHAQRYTRIQIAFSPKDIPCPKCVEEIQNLKRRNRRVCSGCRHDYYNHKQDSSRGVSVASTYGCWYLRKIKYGKCPMYSRY